MKKRTVLLSALLLSSGLVSCDFLDIDTPGIVNKDKMFENEQGFIDAMNGVYATFFEGACPARSAVEVARLPKDALVEIECIAVL